MKHKSSKRITTRLTSLLSKAAPYAWWLLLTIVSVFVALQLHATLVYMGYTAVQNPSTRPPGWNTYTIRGLSRFLYVLVGGGWLAFTIFVKAYFEELRPHKLHGRALFLAGILAAVYLISYLTLYLLAWAQS